MDLPYQEVLHGIDKQTADLIIQLQLQDADLYSSSSKGKGREDEISDESIAFQLQKEELNNASQFNLDRRMAQSIAHAVQTDGTILAENISQEEIAARDRGIAQQYRNGLEPSNTDPPVTNPDPQQLDDELLAKLAVLYVTGFDETRSGEEGHEQDGQPESSTWAASRLNPSSTTAFCEACQEEKQFYEVARVPCRHEYCRECLGDLFKASMTDASLFPPRCCRQNITTASVRIFLDFELVQAFEKKKIEFETPNRTYCNVPTCSEFINPQNINGDEATCLKCDSKTCTICKAATHIGDCPFDTTLHEVLDAARENGWQRCYSCHSIIELRIGCNHMTCRCGAQFCYDCGEIWKTCTCDHWEERRLLDRANQIINRERGPQVGPRRLRVAQAVQNLRDNHECLHLEWRFIRGPHRCEECSYNLPDFIFQCEQCNIQACKRCKLNRL